MSLMFILILLQVSRASLRDRATKQIRVFKLSRLLNFIFDLKCQSNKPHQDIIR